MAKINQLESLKVLKAVVETGNFTAAAKRLDLSVARISKSIEHLEIEFGTKLFNRSTRHMQLTENGKRSYRYALKLIEQWRNLTDELTETQTSPKGKLLINIPMTWGLCVFSSILAKFMSKYPAISINVHMNDQHVNVVEGEYDLVLRLTNKLQDSALLCKKLTSCKYITCATPEYLSKHGTPKTPEDLKRHSCLVYSQQGVRRKWQFMKEKEIFEIYIEPRLQSNNSVLLKEALLSNQGISSIPEFVVKNEINSGKLNSILTEYTTNDLNLYSLRPIGHIIPYRLQLLDEFLADELTSK